MRTLSDLGASVRYLLDVLNVFFILLNASIVCGAVCELIRRGWNR
ncbi:hypothetical protein [Kitasatospora purpeofusca]|uniref:Uncharacterized protein n=1 Tax=Kitasatospora purpeofusca TaxID=67352 RepID=A0ABZ1U4K2_9ACTN|nr:hypothetical protein [Kitasatospora purpeofusca]